jgi:uncharacterized repeat protein (TIGR03806 family)
MNNPARNKPARFSPLCGTATLILMAALLTPTRIEAQMTRVQNTTLHFPTQPPAPPSGNYILTNLFPSLQFIRPVAIATPPGETNRLFVVEREGRIQVINDLSHPSAELFMDISSRVTASDWVNNRRTEGLSSIAFHPDFKNNGRFFVTNNTLTNTSQGDGNYNRLSEFRASSDGRHGLPGSEIIYINQFDEGDGHNINEAMFGPDGYLYVATGDEGDGGTGDDYNNAQKIDKDFFSAIMRIDVDKRPGNLPPNPHPANSQNYSVPADNPFVGAETFNGLPVDKFKIHDEFWAVGFRNPWRFSFDPLTGTIYEGDVGQHTREEINRVVRGGNYGWSFKEGSLNGPKGPVPTSISVIDPIMEYSTGYGPDWGFSVTCGVVYRGDLYPDLYGKLVYADYVSGNVWLLDADAESVDSPEWILGRTGIAGFGYDPRNGDVLAIDHDRGQILALRMSNEPVESYPQKLSETGIFSDLGALTPNPGIYPYDVNVSFWSDGANKRRWFSLPGLQQKIHFDPEGNWGFPVGGIWIKHFDLQTEPGNPASARRIETRVLVNGSNGLYGLTYKWNDDGSDATLVPESGEDQTIQIQDGNGTHSQTWHFPSRSECLSCHTPAAGYVLGFNTPQMNRDQVYSGNETNQISALAAAGFFDNPPETSAGWRALAPLDAETVSRTYRVKSYLAANCVYCHQPEGTAHTAWDARITTPLSLANIINGPLANNLGDPNNRVIIPNDPAHSAISLRVSTRGGNQMPPLASTVIDQEAVNLLRDWITKDLPDYETYDQWMDRAFGSDSGVDASPEGDPDGDGIENYTEYLISSDPLSPGNPLDLNLNVTNSTAHLTVTQPPNRAILLDSSTNLSDGSWKLLPVPENKLSFPATPVQKSVSDPLSPPREYYRVRVIEP